MLKYPCLTIHYVANGYHIFTMLPQISGHLIHWIIETSICFHLIGDLLFDAEGKTIHIKEEEQEINLYYSCASMNCIFHETA